MAASLKLRSFPMLLSARAAVAEGWSPGLWTTSKCIPLCRMCSPVFFPSLQVQFLPLWACQYLFICVEATPWGLSMKYTAIDLCCSYICLLTQFHFRPFILVLWISLLFSWRTLQYAYALRLVQRKHNQGQGPSYHSWTSKKWLSLGQEKVFAELLNVNPGHYS